MKSLRRESFEDPGPFDLVKRGRWDDLELYGVRHPLLGDARQRFGHGLPDAHKSASQALGERVFEVRDAATGMRGAVVLDAEGDPWLVYAERHDLFHSHVAAFLKAGNFMPVAAEYRIRDREEALVATRTWRSGALSTVLDAISDATRSGGEVNVDVVDHPGGGRAQLVVSVEHDGASPDAAQAHLHLSMVTVRLSISSRSPRVLRDELVGLSVPFLQPDPQLHDAAYGRDGSLTLIIQITQAKLIQLVGQPVDLVRLPHPAAAMTPTHLHYVVRDYLVDAYVEGTPVRGVCGMWFVPTRDAEAVLPICGTCEQERPVAEVVLDLIRKSRANA